MTSQGRLVLKQEAATSRLFVYLIGSYIHRIERQRCDFYFGDFDLARVSETIAMAGVEPGMRDADFRDQHRTFDTIIGVDGQRAVNASSIASATGMSRETVRRKLKQLLKLGFIVEKGRSHYVLKPGILQQPDRQAAFARGIQSTVQFMNECLEQGVIQWIPARKTTVAASSTPDVHGRFSRSRSTTINELNAVSCSPSSVPTKKSVI